jgi:glycosyltransferase involved in cell wall biosynthesis
MRLALFTETFLPKVDGIVNTLCHLLEHLDARGHETLLFAPEGGPKQFAGAPVHSLPAARFVLYPELKLASPLANVRPALNRFRPDLIHVLNPVSLGLAGVWYARTRGIPLVASYHTDVPGFAARWGWGWVNPLLWAFFRTLHNFANLNLAPSRVTQRELQANSFKRVKVWGRGVDTDLFTPARRSREWRERLSDGRPDALLLLYVGRLSVEKRVHWLRPLLDALPGARLALVGDGPARASLETLFAGTPTVFTGYLRGADLAHAYAAADIFVFPAMNETLGNVVLEAMASGLPVVAPRSGGLLDHLTHGHNGLLFEPFEPGDLAANVGHLARFPEYARRLSAAGRRHAESRRWDVVLDGLLEEYAAVLQRHARMQRAQRVRRVAPVFP